MQVCTVGIRSGVVQRLCQNIHIAARTRSLRTAPEHCRGCQSCCEIIEQSIGTNARPKLRWRCSRQGRLSLVACITTVRYSANRITLQACVAAINSMDHCARRPWFWNSVACTAVCTEQGLAYVGPDFSHNPPAINHTNPSINELNYTDPALIN